MCFDSGADEAAEEAERARKEEEARVARIRAGTQRINEIFEGGVPAGVGRLDVGTAFDPSKKYYLPSGQLWTPQTGTSPATSSTTMERYKRAGREGTEFNSWRPVTTTTPGTPYGDPRAQFLEALKGGLYTGAKTSTGAFGGDFFDKRRQAYIDYATPQLTDQFKDAQKELTFALARSGNLDSSSRASQEADLGKLYTTQQQDIADRALGYEKEARTAVEDARSGLIATLNATGDAEGAAKGALARAAALSRPDTYSPLSQLFSDFTASLGMQAALERSERAAGKDYARYDTGLFAPRRSSTVVQ
jgi:hypothetical protein